MKRNLCLIKKSAGREEKKKKREKREFGAVGWADWRAATQLSSSRVVEWTGEWIIDSRRVEQSRMKIQRSRVKMI